MSQRPQPASFNGAARSFAAMPEGGQAAGRAGPPRPLLTRKEVAQIYGLPQGILEKYACRGDGPVMVRIGRAIRYKPEDVEAWINARRVRSTSEGR